MSDQQITLEIALFKKGHIAAERRWRFTGATEAEVDMAAAQAAADNEWLARCLTSPTSLAPERRVAKTYT